MHPVVAFHGTEAVVFKRTKRKICIAAYVFLVLPCLLAVVACAPPPPTALDLKQALADSYACPLLVLSDVGTSSIKRVAGNQYEVGFSYTVAVAEAPATLARRFAEWAYREDELLRLRRAYGQADFRLDMNSAAKAEAAQTLKRIDTQA
ncbi:MAG: hypothetical protein JWL63_1643, partial [Rhodocyclales bacterium]|nr:hypothetical protein [Rhodocyclales bacterium]